jgi:hypothetical protein
MRITVVTEGLSPEICASMGMGHVCPQGLAAYIKTRLAENPDLKIGVLRHSGEIAPILATRG